MRTKEWVFGLRSLLFPPHCDGCGQPIEQVEAEPLCPACRRDLPWMESPFPRDGPCSPFRHEGAARELVQALKYRGRTAAAAFLSQGMLSAIQKRCDLGPWDAVLPIPLHPTRLRERGFNQAQMLAKSVAAGLGIPCRTDFLVRVRATRPQTELPREERAANLWQAFALADGLKNLPSRILLVDDVFTTGSTAGSCARLLKRAGAGRVDVLTATRG